MRTISEYKTILQKKGWYVCCKELKKSLCPIWFTHNRGAIEQIETERVYKYLKRKYSSIYLSDVEDDYDKNPSRIIWICWLQGRNVAPEIVQKCINSVEKYAYEYEVKILTEENMLEYVSMPKKVIEKYKKGKISFTQFSDVLRCCLLYEHGGIWMDSTVLLTDNLPSYVTDNHFFVFRTSMLSKTYCASSSWFILAQKGHPIMKLCRDLLFSYWEKESYLKNYYIFHIFFYLLVTENPICRKLFNQMPYIPNVDSHTLQFILSEPYSEKNGKK